MTDSNSEVSSPSRGDPWFVAGIAVLAIAMRALFIGRQSFTMDELAELAIARGEWGPITWAADGFPPLYHLLLREWLEAFGRDSSARWLSVLLGLLTVFAVWRLASLLTNRRAALWSALLMALLPFNILYSQEARAYSLFVLASALSMWLFFAARETNNPRQWAWFVLASLVGMYSHYFFAVVPAVLFLLLWLEEGFREGSRSGWVALAVIIVGCAPLVVIFGADLSLQTGYDHQTPFDAGAFGYTYLSFVTGHTLGASIRELHTMGAAEALRELAPWSPLILTGVVVAGSRGVLSLRSRGSAVRLLALVLLPVLIIGTLATIGGVGYKVRYVAWVSVPVVVWLGAGIAGGTRRWPGLLALSCLLAVFLPARWNRLMSDRYLEEDTRALAAYLVDREPRNDPILVSVGYMADGVRYYLPTGIPVLGLPDPESESHEPAEAVQRALAEAADGPSFWLVYTRPFHGDPAGLLLSYLTSSGYVTHEASFAGIELYRGTGGP